MLRSNSWILGVLAVVTACAAPQPPDNVDPDERYAAVAERVRAFITHEMEGKGLPALPIALVDDQEVVWAEGFGFESLEDSVQATASTVFRVGSVSKLFTDLAVMRQAERGVLDLDAPITSVLADFTPSNPFGGEITLRQLTSHRAGLVREPPVGHYFDDTEPTIEATVASLSNTELVYAPEARSKYSNAGIAAVGQALAVATGDPFEQHLRTEILEPLVCMRAPSRPPMPSEPVWRTPRCGPSTVELNPHRPLPWAWHQQGACIRRCSTWAAS